MKKQRLAEVLYCASCGISEIDDVKLTSCPNCDLVRYCSDECQDNHREKHESICKERAAELRDEILFRQPESSHLGDCPICMLPMPLDKEASLMQVCCGKLMCLGCFHAHAKHKKSLELSCPFCRLCWLETARKCGDSMMFKGRIK